jgi:hypothetical protein
MTTTPLEELREAPWAEEATLQAATMAALVRAPKMVSIRAVRVFTQALVTPAR